jgi:hypothetical protein
MKAARAGVAFDRLAPEFDRLFVWNEFTATGVVDEDAPDRTVDSQVAEDIAAGAMEEVRDRSENLALSAFARARGSEEENCSVFHSQ